MLWFTPLLSTQSVRLTLVTYLWLCSTCVTYGTPCHTIGHQMDFPRGGNHSKHVPLLTYLDWRSFACGEDFNKKHRAAITLISNHESGNKNNCSFKKKMHFRTWMLKDSSRRLLIKKLAYKYYQKMMLSAAEILLI